MRKEYLTLNRVQGPLIVLSNVKDVAYDEIVDIIVDGKDKKKGKVVQIHKDKAIIQVFESTIGMSVDNTSVHFRGESLKIPLSKDILGREFNGVGECRDKG